MMEHSKLANKHSCKYKNQYTKKQTILPCLFVCLLILFVTHTESDTDITDTGTGTPVSHTKPDHKNVKHVL